MQPDDPRHGQYKGAQAHWREDVPLCDPCRKAVHRYQKRRKADVARNIPRRVSAAAVRDHLRALAAQGMTDGDIADRSGVHISVVQTTRSGTNPRILSVTAAAILGVHAEPNANGWVDALGSRRRIQALAALGWTKQDIVNAASRLGYPLTIGALGWVTQARSVRGRARVQTRDAISAAYDELSMTLPESNRSSNRTRAWAAAAGHRPPLAWDDIDNDPEPPSVESEDNYEDTIDHVVVQRVVDSNQRTRKLTRTEAAEVVRLLLLRGLSTYRIENDYGLKVDRYWKVDAIEKAIERTRKAAA